jgi:hypothetical protein
MLLLAGSMRHQQARELSSFMRMQLVKVHTPGLGRGVAIEALQLWVDIHGGHPMSYRKFVSAAIDQ